MNEIKKDAELKLFRSVPLNAELLFVRLCSVLLPGEETTTAALWGRISDSEPLVFRSFKEYLLVLSPDFIKRERKWKNSFKITKTGWTVHEKLKELAELKPEREIIRNGITGMLYMDDREKQAIKYNRLCIECGKVSCESGPNVCSACADKIASRKTNDFETIEKGK